MMARKLKLVRVGDGCYEAMLDGAHVATISHADAGHNLPWDWRIEGEAMSELVTQESFGQTDSLAAAKTEVKMALGWNPRTGVWA